MEVLRDKITASILIISTELLSKTGASFNLPPSVQESRLEIYVGSYFTEDSTVVVLEAILSTATFQNSALTDCDDI